MESDRDQYPDPASVSVSQSEIDPRLQEAVSTSQHYSEAPAPTAVPGSFRLPPPPAQPYQQHQHQQHQQHHQPQHHQQHQYGVPPPQWTQDGYSPFYQPPITHIPHHTTHAYQAYQESSGTPTQPPIHVQLHEASDSKRSRACEACRNLKVRCEPDPATGTCKRCAKANRHCIITAPSRKRQKKTDSRVAELERKIDALTRSLQSTTEGHISGSDDGDDGGDTLPTDATGRTPFALPARRANIVEIGQKRDYSEYQQDQYPASYAPPPVKTTPFRSDNPPYMTPEAQMAPKPVSRLSKNEDPGSVTLTAMEDVDVVGRGILPTSTAEELFGNYTEDMAPHMPIVVFPKNTTADRVRKSSPLLFLAILSVASGRQYPDLHRTLNKEVMRSLADRIINGETKSLEMIQTLQVITIWYLPEPEKESKYYQLVHMAAGMAIDLGINKKSEKKRNRFRILQHNSSVIDTESIECRRAWVGCYFLYSSIAMGMRRHNLIRNDGHLQDCMTQLPLSADAAESDAMLCQIAYLQTLADDLSAQILPDDYVAVSENKARNAYKGFEKQMKDWQEQKDGNVESLSPTLAFNVTNLYMHELVMQHVASFEPAKPVSRARGKTQSQASSSTQASSLSIAVTATIGILTTFSKFTNQAIRTLPTFYFAQIAHASVSLIKLYYVAQADADSSKHAPVTAAVIEEHLGHLSEALRSASDKSLAAHTSLKMIITIQTLFREHKDSSLATIKARYSGVPSLKGTQILDLGEPQPTPQQRTVPRKSGQSSDDALHMLSAVAMGNTNADGYSAGEGQTNVAASAPVEGEVAAMGQLIGEEDMGFMNDDGFFGIMQQMWARSV